MWSLLCIPPLAAMVISDLRSRRIGMAHLIIFGITLLTVSILEFGWRQVMVNVSFNLLTVLLLWLSLYGYSSIRKRRLADMIGGGDFAFALAAMPYLEIREYILFLISGFDMAAISRLLDMSLNNVYAHKRRLRLKIEKKQPPHAQQFLEMIS